MTNKVWDAIAPERGVWTLEYSFSKTGTANAVAVRLKDGQLAVISPPCRASEAIDGLRDKGDVVALIAPNGFHHLGLPEWHAAFPKARVFAPEHGKKRVAKKHAGLDVESLDDIAPLLPDDMWIGEPPHMKFGDACAHIQTEHGELWYFNDIVMNLPNLDSFPAPIRLIFKLTKSGPGFSVTRMLAPLVLKDKKGYRDFLVERLAKHPPARVMLGHGTPVTDPSEAAGLRAMMQDAL